MSPLSEFVFAILLFFAFIILIVVPFKISILETAREERIKKEALRSIKSGEYFKKASFNRTILKEIDKELIEAIYDNIEKSNFTDIELLKFLNKNKLEINKKITMMLL